MSNEVVHGVVGLDGNVPIYQPDARWCIWGFHEIYNGQIGLNKYIPKVNDYVIDPETFTTFSVDALDPVTLIATLREVRPANMSYVFNETDVLFGVGPGTQSDTYRVYLDKSVTPYVLAVDARLSIGGSSASYAKLFKSSVLDSSGEVISKIFDNSGNFISNNVPLELVILDSHINYSKKIISVCNTTEDMQDNEIVTAVIYSDTGHVISKRQLLVENTSFIRSVNVAQKYISHISLNSPFMSPTIENRIDFPLNIPLNSLNLTGTVHYSDGSTMKLPVDGVKFRIHGLDQYVSTIIGQKINLVLSYSLGVNETAYAGVSSDGNYINEAYTLVTTNPNNSYTVKLFGYPVWVDSANGYNMSWYLYNLERNIYFDVTPYVSFSSTTGAYNPKAYGILQRKSVSINLKDITSSFKSFIHTQLIDIVLNGVPDSVSYPWNVSHESVSLRPAYGVDLFAKKISGSVIKISNDISTYTEWLEKVYYNTYPIINSVIETFPMVPTHFVVKYDNYTVEKAISEWDSNIELSTTVTDYKTITIRFIKKTSTGDLQLSIAAMIVKP